MIDKPHVELALQGVWGVTCVGLGFGDKFIRFVIKFAGWGSGLRFLVMGLKFDGWGLPELLHEKHIRHRHRIVPVHLGRGVQG